MIVGSVIFESSASKSALLIMIESVLSPSKGKKRSGRASGMRIGYDAEILIVRLHENIGRREMDLVRTPAAPDDEEAIAEGTLCGNLESRHQALQDLLAGCGGAGQLAERIALPVVAIASLGATVLPCGIVADRRDADEEIDIAHDLRKHER